MKIKEILECPVCRNQLSNNKNSYQCTNKHSFDKSKTGYINLLLSNQKKSPNPGDSKEMLKARTSFFKEGFYTTILNLLTKTIKSLTKDKVNQTILDIGCGEGYYLLSVFNNLPNTTCYGLDISKDGIEIASKYEKST